MEETKLQLYPSLTYQLIGVAYNVFNKLGYGYQEKYYQRGYAKELTIKHLPFKRELMLKIVYGNEIIGRYFIDFVVENKVAIEFKVANEFYKKHIKQILAYLKASGLKVGLLIIFTKNGVKCKRLVN
jgi:GxxExxY protein